MLTAGELRTRGVFEEDRGTSDSSTGQRTPDWQALYQCWALVELTVGDRWAPLRQRYPAARWGIAIRYASEAAGVRPPHRYRVPASGAVYAVTGTWVDPDGRKDEMLFPADLLFPIEPVTDR